MTEKKTCGSSCFTLPRLWLGGSSCQTAVGASGEVRATMLPDEKYTNIYKYRTKQIYKYTNIHDTKYKRIYIYKTFSSICQTAGASGKVKATMLPELGWIKYTIEDIK